MLGVGWEDLSGRYLLEWMPFAHGNTDSCCWRKVRGCVCGAVCHFVVEQVFSGAFEEAMRWCACAARRLDTVCWFMLGCVAFSVYCHTGCAHKWKMRRICV